jgi:two-component system nitrogen regulation response regulator GlnG
LATLLIVDDERTICWGLERLATQLGHIALVAPSAELGLQLAEHNQVDLLLLDVRLPGIDGIAAIDKFRQHVGDAPVVVMTAFGDLATAMRALAAGAFEYVVKPFDLDEIAAAIDRALQPPRQSAEWEPNQLAGMIGESPIMRGLFKRIALAAHSDASVMLLGETGTGKHLAACTIHQHSRRSAGPFVVASLAGRSDVAIEAELFGTAPDPFGGAGPRGPGLLAEADGGTLYLEEVTDLPLSLQAALLRALDRGEFTPLGGEATVRSNFRIVSASTHDLESCVAGGQLRQDLFFRLSAFPILLPPLRDREDDVVALAESFARTAGTPDTRLDAATRVELRRRRWHGNIRELRSAIEHALVLCRAGTIQPAHLPPEAATAAPTDSHAAADQLSVAIGQFADQLLADESHNGSIHERFIEAVEPALLAKVLAQFGGEVAPAARALGLHRTTLRRKLDQYGIDNTP